MYVNMLNMSEPEDVSDELRKPVKESLLNKYRIPLNHFELDYIGKCTNPKELERILKVLRSGEEGYFPHLIEAAEVTLKIIKPKSKLLRTSVRVLDKSELDEVERKGITQDLNEWLRHVSVSDQELKVECKTKSSYYSTEVRRTAKVTTDTEQEENKEKPRICSTDYAAWDKYDPDTEIVKMDLDEEKKIKEAMKKTKNHTGNPKNFNITTEARKDHFSNQERVKGNECFKIKEYEEALRYYTNSITLKANVDNLNNRAATYLKLAKYQEALEDCESVLKIDESNVKAHLRTAEAMEKLRNYDEALDAIQFVIRANPNDDWAQKFAEKVREKCDERLQTTRIRITEIE